MDELNDEVKTRVLRALGRTLIDELGEPYVTAFLEDLFDRAVGDANLEGVPDFVEPMLKRAIRARIKVAVAELREKLK